MEQEYHPLRSLIAESLGGSPSAQWTATGIMLLATTALFLFAWKMLNRLRAYLQRQVDQRIGGQIKALRIQKQRIFSEEDISALLRGAIRIFDFVLKLLLLLLYVNFSLSYFEWFLQVTLNIFSFLGATLAQMASAVIDYLPSLVIVALIILLSRFVIRLLRVIFDGLRRERIRIPGFYPEWARTSFNLVRVAVIAVTVVVIFPYLPGSSSPAFKGLSIFFGVLVSLGSTAAIGHLVAGIVITYTRAFRMGDRVRIADTEGDIIERSAFVTRIRTPKNVEVAIPNAMVMNNHIVNYSAQARDGGVLLHTTVTIGYDVPWPRVHELLIEAARRTDHLEAEPAPFVLQTALQDDYVAYELNACTRVPSSKTGIYSNLHAHIQDCFREAGVEILSPRYRAVRDGNASTVPPSMPETPDPAED
jgi:small-conductance mechanosensitive channel